ncbi:DUF4062 domain-containing protein [Pseudomonas sp. PB3P13]
MAKPKVFISSTYFDLKNIRADLERFVSDQGYDPVLNERGHIPYGNDEKLEEYCYKEIHSADILVSIIGGRYGSQSKVNDHSISNTELKTAIELGKQVYIFISKEVHLELRTYAMNKHLDQMSYASVDDKRIFKFIEEIQALPANNPIANFETSSDITNYLKEQWAGLFQRLLAENSKHKEFQVLNEIKATAQTLNQLVTLLTEERKTGDQAFKEILLTNHPIFSSIRNSLNINHRIFFSTQTELNELLSSNNFKEVPTKAKDNEHAFEWINNQEKPNLLLKIRTDIFDNLGKLKIFTPEQWQPEFVSLKPFIENLEEMEDDYQDESYKPL